MEFLCQDHPGSSARIGLREGIEDAYRPINPYGRTKWLIEQLLPDGK